MAERTDIHIYAHWIGMEEPKEIGVLTAVQGKAKKTFSFEYNREWLKDSRFFLLDPDLDQFTGPQYPRNKENFGVFMDSMPDTWGRTLMRRRAADVAREQGKPNPTLYDIEYLLGVNDMSRMGALRFKLDPGGPFLDDNRDSPTPPWAHIGELQESASRYEKDEDAIDVRKDVKILLAPGSSLGGARPKANIIDEKGQLWIAKFPSNSDTTNKGAWEYLAYRLATGAGINMAESQLLHVSGKYDTFLTKRFDRELGHRIHFSSAMTMTGNIEGNIPEETGYLDIAEFIQRYGKSIEADLHQLWRRIIFNIAISNTDDHLRNHGFVLTDKGWTLSPAYDINPSIDKDSLALTIDSSSSALDFDLAFSVGEYFRLDKRQMEDIFHQVSKSVSNWRTIAREIGISRSEVEQMSTAFQFDQ
ncbi:type II toxin-antitoxin system HipA family toxin [Pedobacter deserti]|uniref:type II toxin-antitoxin system HipA family toxin n=1 Tax=Pedobacter deserti TaxID=2817382 RepID=UPI00210E28CF|nr:HipA domain-containing protein [Pedobacter sp. SYSU D00382]